MGKRIPNVFDAVAASSPAAFALTDCPPVSTPPHAFAATVVGENGHLSEDDLFSNFVR